jgi:hypothetical protein
MLAVAVRWQSAANASMAGNNQQHPPMILSGAAWNSSDHHGQQIKMAMLQQLPHTPACCASDVRTLCTFPEGSQCDLLLAVDFEQGIQTGDLKQVCHSLVEPGEFHLASPLPDHAIASDQFTHAVAVHVIHPREVQQELLVAVVGKDVDQIAQLRATIT